MCTIRCAPDSLHMHDILEPASRNHRRSWHVPRQTILWPCLPPPPSAPPQMADALCRGLLTITARLEALPLLFASSVPLLLLLLLWLWSGHKYLKMATHLGFLSICLSYASFIGHRLLSVLLLSPPCTFNSLRKLLLLLFRISLGVHKSCFLLLLFLFCLSFVVYISRASSRSICTILPRTGFGISRRCTFVYENNVCVYLSLSR